MPSSKCRISQASKIGPPRSGLVVFYGREGVPWGEFSESGLTKPPGRLL